MAVGARRFTFRRLVMGLCLPLISWFSGGISR